MVIIYNGRSTDTMDYLRCQRFREKTASSATHVHPQTIHRFRNTLLNLYVVHSPLEKPVTLAYLFGIAEMCRSIDRLNNIDVCQYIPVHPGSTDLGYEAVVAAI